MKQLKAIELLKEFEDIIISSVEDGKYGNATFCFNYRFLEAIVRYKGKTIHTKYGFKTAYDGAVHRDKYLDYNNLPHTRSL